MPGKVTPNFKALALLISLYLLAVHSLKAQESNPWYFRAQQTWGHESNVFRLPQQAGGPSDHIQSTQAEIGVNKEIGRQVLDLGAQWQTNQYQKLTSLNYDGWSLNGRLYTSLPERTALSIKALISETMAPFNPGNTPLITERNIAHTEQWQALLEVGSPAPLRAELMARHESLDYSTPLYAPYNVNHQTAAVGLAYQPRTAVLMRLALSQHWFERPQAYRIVGGFEAERYQQQTFDLEGRWLPRDDLQWRWQATVGPLRSLQSQLEWKPTGQTQLSAQIQTQQGRQNFTSPTLETGFNTRRSEKLGLQAQWQISAHWLWTLSSSWMRRRIQDEINNNANNIGISTSTTDDQTQQIQTGLIWSITRALQSNCQINHSQREVKSATIAGSSYASPFQNTGIYCGISLTK